jgi:hypothetical protein
MTGRHWMSRSQDSLGQATLGKLADFQAGVCNS